MKMQQGKTTPVPAHFFRVPANRRQPARPRDRLGARHSGNRSSRHRRPQPCATCIPPTPYLSSSAEYIPKEMPWSRLHGVCLEASIFPVSFEIRLPEISSHKLRRNPFTFTSAEPPCVFQCACVREALLSVLTWTSSFLLSGCVGVEENSLRPSFRLKTKLQLRLQKQCFK